MKGRYMAYDPNKLRTVRLSPYRKGMGPVFTLTTWDTGRRDNRGSTYQRYRLSMDGKPLFEGDDYSPSPTHASDGDAAIGALLGLLTMRPGDTDTDYFKDYTPEQLEFASQHAESLSCEAERRFGTL